MDSKHHTDRRPVTNNPGTQGYGIIAGVICLDLLMLLGKLPLAMLLSALLISLIIIYRIITLPGKETGSTESPDLQAAPDGAATTNDSALPETDPAPGKIPAVAAGTLRDIRVLLVSGSKREQREMADHLNSWGVVFVQVGSSARAFAMLVESADSGKPFHTVLIDQASLDMEACQFATALRAEPLLQSLYLIHYGNNMPAPRSEQLYTAGYSGILSAPLDKTLLFKTLHDIRETSLHHHNVVQLLDHYEPEKGQQPLDILIACSNINECRKVHRILDNAGHQAFIISDTAQILDALDNHHFDLAILDAEMPEISGIEAIKLYRFAHLNQPWTPFILLLDAPDSRTIKACETADIDHLLVKPISTRRLLEMVSQVATLATHSHNEEIFDYPSASGSIQYHDESLTLDIHQLDELKRLGKELSFLLALINQFDKESGALIQGLRLAINEQDIKSIQDYGHKLKDAAGNLGALNLYRMAVRLTRIRRPDPDYALQELLAELEECRIATIDALHHHLFQDNNSAHKRE